MRLKSGDKVIVIAGQDRGRSGKVLRVFPARRRLIVEGVNLVKKRQRPRRAREKGQTIIKAMPFDASNVQLFCERCRRGVRIGMKTAGPDKTRICRRCGQAI